MAADVKPSQAVPTLTPSMNRGNIGEKELKSLSCPYRSERVEFVTLALQWLKHSTVVILRLRSIWEIPSARHLDRLVY